LECDEDALLVRAQQAKEPARKIEILAAAEDKSGLLWNELHAEALFVLGQYAEAAECYQLAPQNRETYSRMEVCYRELGDYRKAYEYACKQR